jgi:general secretion pathway protein G
MNSRARKRERGFTLISMMVVISIMIILLGVAMPIYSHSILRAREENLRHNLDTLNQMIFQYTLDRQKTPDSLEDLRSAGYLQTIPDDITGSDTWEVEPAEGVKLSLYPSGGQRRQGLFDLVRAGVRSQVSRKSLPA